MNPLFIMYIQNSNLLKLHSARRNLYDKNAASGVGRKLEKKTLS